ncbi:polysaccharide pyruvyl transferase family protein [Enterococcus casseliflavus]
MTDVAFTLPSNSNKMGNSSKIKVGINVSQPLWLGGYSKKNQFNLSVDHKNYINDLICFFVDKDYIVYLVPHVVSTEIGYEIENDLLISQELANKYDVKLAPIFTSPMEAKSFISGLDMFVGSRMHATIAAVFAGVPCIPVAYSRKFSGLFENISYNYVIDLVSMNNEDALNLTKKYVESVDLLKTEEVVKEEADRIYGSFKNAIKI